MKEKLLEESKFIISRYDHYYETINSKGNLYLAINTFILGGIISGYSTLDKQYDFNLFTKCLFILTLVLNICSIAYTLLAIRPYSNKNKQGKSLYYFRDVASINEEEYTNTFTSVSGDHLLSDAISQIHKLAIGLKSKFSKITNSSVLIGLQVLLILIFTLIITFK